MDIYLHILPNTQEEIAKKLEKLLY